MEFTMFTKSFIALMALGQATALSSRIATSGNSKILSSRDSLAARQDNATPVNGTITSLRVLEGDGCPAGTYHLESFEPNKSLSTAVKFDSFGYNSATSSGPVACTVGIDFSFNYPESGIAQIYVSTDTAYTTAYEEGDEEKATNFNLRHELITQAGPEGFDVSTVRVIAFYGSADIT